MKGNMWKPDQSAGTEYRQVLSDDKRAPLQYLSAQAAIQAAAQTEIMRRLQSIDERLGRIEQVLGAHKPAGDCSAVPGHHWNRM